MTVSICYVIPHSSTKKYEYTAKSQQTSNELIMTPWTHCHGLTVQNNDDTII